MNPSHFPRLFLLLGLAQAAHAQISLFSAVDLAKRNSAPVKIAQADVDKAAAAVGEARAAYLPALQAGSNVGYSYGFPVGQPTLYSASGQSLALSFSQPDYIRATRAALDAAALSLRDAVDQVELDTALDYLQLNTITQQIAALDESKSYAERLEQVEQSRLQAGVESEITATRAQLSAAQSDLKRLDLLAQAALLRARLGNLTGMPEDAMRPEPESVPGPPAGENTAKPRRPAGVDAAFSNALSKHYIAHGDDRVVFRPQVGFGIQYSRYAKFNNYQLYYLRFQQNNFDVGLQLTLPLFDATKSAKARESAADALHADRQAEQARQQSDEAAVQLEKSIATLRAQSRIADLQAKLAAQQLQAVLLQIRNPPTAPGVLPLTPVDEMEARINERARFTEALDARFLLLKAQLSLLRTNGGLGEWINQSVR